MKDIYFVIFCFVVSLCFAFQSLMINKWTQEATDLLIVIRKIIEGDHCVIDPEGESDLKGIVLQTYDRI